tara:strand:- start:6107 stop:6295 length:189 start_codon:yes stop_codon:yes gene_type:complete
MKTILYFLVIVLISSCGILPQEDEGIRRSENGDTILSYTLKSKKELMKQQIFNKNKIILTDP